MAAPFTQPGTATRGGHGHRGGAAGSAGAPVTIFLPVFPAFSYQEAASIAKLNQLAYDAAFLLTPPGQILISSAVAQSIPGSTLTAITWQSVSFSGGAVMWTSGSQVTAQVPGYYDLDAQLTYASNSTGARAVMFRVTTGPANPGGAGNATIFGQFSTAAAAGAGVSTGVATGMLSPYMYAGDYVEVLAYQTSGGALNTAAPWCLLAACLTSLGP